MYCKKCGKEISDDSEFCKFCGSKQHYDKKQDEDATRGISNEDIFIQNTKTNEAKQENATEIEEPDVKNCIIITIIVIIVIIAIASFPSQDNKTPTQETYKETTENHNENQIKATVNCKDLADEVFKQAIGVNDVSNKIEQYYSQCSNAEHFINKTHDKYSLLTINAASLAEYYKKNNNYTKAIEYYKKTIAYADKSKKGFIKSTIWTYANGLADLYYDLGKYELADEYYSTALNYAYGYASNYANVVFIHYKKALIAKRANDLEGYKLYCTYAREEINKMSEEEISLMADDLKRELQSVIAECYQ